MLKIRIAQTRESVRDCERAWDRLEGAIRVLPERVAEPLVALMQEAIKDIFTQEGIPKWKGLALPTVRRRKSLGYGGWHPILVRTGSLFESLYEGVTSERRGADLTIILTSADWRFPILHAGAAQVNIPSRPMLPAGPYAGRLLLVAEREIIFPAIGELVGVERFVRRY